LPKKIEFDLLLADLALQLGNPLGGAIRWRGRLRSRSARRHSLPWPAWAAKRLRPARSEAVAPDVQIFAQNDVAPAV
jgi:hypothetical protein